MIYLEFFCMGDLSPLFICSIIYIVWTHGCLFYNLSYNLVPLSLFSYSDCSNFCFWELFQLSPLVHLTQCHQCVCVWVCFNTSLLSGTKRYSRFTLCSACPSPRSNYFSKEPCFLLLEKGYQKPRSEPYMSLLLLGCCFFQTLSPDKRKKYVCKQIHKYL